MEDDRHFEIELLQVVTSSAVWQKKKTKNVELLSKAKKPTEFFVMNQWVNQIIEMETNPQPQEIVSTIINYFSINWLRITYYN